MEVKILDKYLSVEEIAENLSIPTETVRVWIRKGRLKAVKLGRHWRIKEVDLQTFIKEQEVK